VRGSRFFTEKAQLLDAERDALLLDVDVEHLGLDHVALLVVLDGLLARLVPVEVGEVDHAVDVAVEADEQTEFGDVLDFAFDDGADRVGFGEDFPRVAHGLLQAERDAALGASISSTMTSTSCEVETILPGWTFFLVQDISETWTRPSTPGSSSTNAP
jgi:hypothetical protein